MPVSRIYLPQPLEVGMKLSLSPAATNHVVRVLRMKLGEVLQVFDGQGQEFQAKLVEMTRRSAEILLETPLVNTSESPLYLHLGQAISRGERMDYSLQKSTELGVKKITPLFSDYVNVSLNKDRLDSRMEHWRGVIISACEQSGRSSIPELAQPMKLAQWLQQSQEELKIMLEPTADQPLALTGYSPRNLALLVGAEGGFSSAEIELAKQQGFLALSFGPRILRTETAAPAAIAVMQYLWGDMGIAAGG